MSVNQSETPFPRACFIPRTGQSRYIFAGGIGQDGIPVFQCFFADVDVCVRISGLLFCSVQTR